MKKLFLIIIIIVISFIKFTPDMKIWAKNPFPKSSIVFNEKLIPIHWQGPPYRDYTTINHIPNKLIMAVINTEDHRFFFHNGIDFIALTRAAKHIIKTGRKDFGASTITMQLARNAFLSPEKTYSRKLKELIFALKIDALLEKNKIMELYLNRIYLGQGAYGVSAAAWRYYGKNLTQLTLAEQAMIAGLPQAPSKNNPIANPKQAISRRNLVLNKMLQHHTINLTDYTQASMVKAHAKIHPWPKNFKAAKLLTDSNQKLIL